MRSDIEKRQKSMEESVNQINMNQSGQTFQSVDQPHSESWNSMKKEVLMEGVSELRDRDRRKCNLVLFNVEESQSEDVEVRKKFDHDRAVNILSELSIPTTVFKPLRLPKSKLPQYAHKPRPLRITVPSTEIRENIVKKAKTLENSMSSEMRNVYIKRDMTRLERREWWTRRDQNHLQRDESGCENTAATQSKHREESSGPLSKLDGDNVPPNPVNEKL